MDPEIKVVPDLSEIAHEAADRIVAAADRAADEGRTFSIALSGGSTPRALYELLAGPAYRQHTPADHGDPFGGEVEQGGGVLVDAQHRGAGRHVPLQQPESPLAQVAVAGVV